MDKLEGDVTAGQDNIAQIVVQKLKADRSYTFRKKGHEEQYRFNADIKSHLNKVQGEAAKIHPPSEKERRSLEALKPQLQEGIQAIVCWQNKRIKVADRSDYGWAVVKAYNNDELASDSEDEKRLFKAEKTAEREISKRKRRSTKGKDVPAYQSTVVTQPIRAAPVSSGIMAGEPAGGTSSESVESEHSEKDWALLLVCSWGHLQKNCPKVAKYPFNWVDSNYCSVKSTGTVTIDTKHKFNVVDLPGYKLTNNNNGVECFDSQEADCLPLCDPLVGRYWEVSENSLQSDNRQILDVQGRLKASSKIWIEVLHAKPLS